MGGFSQNGKKKGKELSLTLSVSLPLASSPKGGANASPRGQQKLNLGEQLPLPSGEVALRSNDGEGLQQPFAAFRKEGQRIGGRFSDSIRWHGIP